MTQYECAQSLVDEMWLDQDIPYLIPLDILDYLASVRLKLVEDTEGTCSKEYAAIVANPLTPA